MWEFFVTWISNFQIYSRLIAIGIIVLLCGGRMIYVITRTRSRAQGKSKDKTR